MQKFGSLYIYLYIERDIYVERERLRDYLLREMILCFIHKIIVYFGVNYKVYGVFNMYIYNYFL